MGELLRQSHEGLINLIADHAPQEAAIEETFVNRDPQSALKLGQARGAKARERRHPPATVSVQRETQL